MAERPTIAIGGTVNYGGYVASLVQENEGGGITREGYATATETSKEYCRLWKLVIVLLFLEVNIS